MEVAMAVSLPMRERELKLRAAGADLEGAGSLPMRERELKRQNTSVACKARHVAPHAGA